MNKKSFLIFTILFCFSTICFSLQEPEEIRLLKKAYPQVKFDTFYDVQKKDWQLVMKVPFDDGSIKIHTLYWAQGRLIPQTELPNIENYTSIFYPYNKGEELQDPSSYTPEQIAIFKEAGNSSNRKNAPYAPDYFFDCIYDCDTRAHIEKQLKTITFLGHKVTIHKKIVEPLGRVEKRIQEMAEYNTKVADFVKELHQTDGYNWREIRDVNRKSFHSTGIALDLLPEKWTKHMYWRWTKDQKGDEWMMTPLRIRWMPPYEVINIFEDEGFIWGGRWIVWDNMHFEYRPDLIEMAKKR